MPPDPITQNIQGVRQLIGSRLNKLKGGAATDEEGVVGQHIDELELSLSDEELIALTRQWEEAYAPYEHSIKQRQEAQKTYYLGRQKENTGAASDGSPISPNLIFEAEETFLPAALSKNPEPVVWCDNTTEGTRLAGDVKTMLQYHADALVLRRKLTLVVRHWSIYFLGVMKHGWDERIQDIRSDVIEPQKLILDPNGTIDSYGDYTGEFLGERKECSAGKLVELFPKHKAFIIAVVNGQMGTKVQWTEWWTNDYTFSTFKGVVLDKSKNPHFNYEREVDGEDEDGAPITDVEKGVNHFGFPKMPYTFLSVFSLGQQPHDDTGLIEQNIPNQRRISRRTEQLDYNLSRANNSDVFSADNFNQETATQAARALAKGNPVLVPSGKPINEAIQRLNAPGVGSEFFVELENSKNDLRSIFGTQGITATQQDEDQTARGMILNQQYDNSRIGGGIGDALEQFADNVFNWWVQLYAVYYDQHHFAAVMGQMKAVEYVELKGSDLTARLVVSVSPDSMKPKDEVTTMNQALALWDKGAIDPKTLLTVLDFPDPQNTAAQAVLWRNDPMAYMQLNFPELMTKLSGLQMQQAMQAPGGIADNGSAPVGPAPEGVTEPEGELSMDPASAALAQVPLPA